MKNSTKLLLIVMLVGVATGMKAQNHHQELRVQNWGYGYSDNSHSQNGHHGFQTGFKGYRGFDWVKTRRVHNGHHSLMIVTLKRHDRYVELTLNHHGRIIEKREYRVGRRRGQGSHRYGGYVYNHQDHYIDGRDQRNRSDYEWGKVPADYGETNSRRRYGNRW